MVNILQNYYTIEGFLGLVVIFIGNRLLESNVYFAVFCGITGFLLMLDAARRWDFLQRNKESISESEAKSKSLDLVYDIKNVTCENDIEWEPEEISSEGHCGNYNPIGTATVIIDLYVHNPNGSLSNTIRDVKATLKVKKTEKDLIIDFNPTKIAPRDSIHLSVKGHIWNHNCSKDENVNVTITTLDGKKVSETGKINRIFDGPDLRDLKE